MKILIAGDFAPRARLAKQIEGKLFAEVFPENLREVIKSADFSFVNFESPVVEDGYKPIPKCGPNLCCSPEAAEAVKYAGFTGVTMANNHIMDYGVDGLRKSVKCCKAQGLDVVGVGNNLKEAESTLYLEKDGKVLAVINCCEHEYSIATDTKAGANPLNPIRQFYTIQEAKKRADYVLVIVHGGHEHFQLPSPRMVEAYRFFVDAGADAVVNHHQHCYSGYETYHGRPIFYGLGNFAFDAEFAKGRESWSKGYVIQLDFSKENIIYEIYPYSQYDKNSKIRLLNKGAFDHEISELNVIISEPMLLEKCVSDYYDSMRKAVSFNLQPVRNRLVLSAFSRNLLPSFLSRRYCANLFNMVDCESHRDMLSYHLKKNSHKC